MSKKFLDLSGLTAYDVRLKSYISGQTSTISDELANEIVRARQAEESLYNTFSAITEGDITASAVTDARMVLLSDRTKAIMFDRASNVDDALYYMAVDSALTTTGRSADAKVTGEKIRALEGQVGDYKLHEVMTEEEYQALVVKDNDTLYFLTEE
jgi:hypothetical protein